MSDNPVPFSEWRERIASGEESYPTTNVLYNWTRPGPVRDEIEGAGIIYRVGGRWIFNPARWRDYLPKDARLAKTLTEHRAGRRP